MSLTIPPSAEVLSMEQREWDARQKKTKFWLAVMSWTVCSIAMIPTLGFIIWAAWPSIGLIFYPQDQEASVAILKDGISRTSGALLFVVVIAFLFELSRSAMSKVRWIAAERLGDRPRTGDHNADNYELLDVSSYYAPTGEFIASVNGWPFVVTRQVNKIKGGKHQMDFSFDELSKAKDKMGFGSSAVMDKDHSVEQDEIIRMALSKIAHQYPKLQSPPPLDYRIDALE